MHFIMGFHTGGEYYLLLYFFLGFVTLSSSIFIVYIITHFYTV